MCTRPESQRAPTGNNRRSRSDKGFPSVRSGAGDHSGRGGVVDAWLRVDILVKNLTGHKLPTAFPSRRAWLHIVVRDRDGKTVFESGALNPDGSFRVMLMTTIHLDSNRILKRSLAVAKSRSTSRFLAIGWACDHRTLSGGGIFEGQSASAIGLSEANSGQGYCGSRRCRR